MKSRSRIGLAPPPRSQTRTTSGSAARRRTVSGRSVQSSCQPAYRGLGNGGGERVGDELDLLRARVWGEAEGGVARGRRLRVGERARSRVARELRELVQHGIARRLDAPAGQRV